MADQHQGGTHGAQFAFQPLDGRQIEMVGGLVEQQDIRLGREHAGEAAAPRLAARQNCRVLAAVQTQPLQQKPRAVRIVARPQPRLHIGERRREAAETGFLRQVTHRRSRLDKNLARIRFHEPGRDPH